MELFIGTSVICLVVWTYLLYKHEARHQETERKMQQVLENRADSKK